MRADHKVLWLLDRMSVSSGLIFRADDRPKVINILRLIACEHGLSLRLARELRRHVRSTIYDVDEARRAARAISYLECFIDQTTGPFCIFAAD